MSGTIIPTPDAARPYAVVVRLRDCVLRSVPVTTRTEAQRVMARLVKDAEADLGDADI